MKAYYRYDEILQEVWYSQGMAMVEALINSMSKRYATAIEAQGGWTKY